MKLTYCPLCRSSLAEKDVDGMQRLACAAPPCPFVHWNNPVPVVAGLVRHEGRYLLARNASWPQGAFSVITGFLENGESPDEAILRETREELGLTGSGCRFIGHFSLPAFNQLIIAFLVEAGGTLQLNEEIAEVRSVSRDQLASFDFGRFALTRALVDRHLGDDVSLSCVSLPSL